MNDSEQSIFLQALDFESIEARADFLNRACGNDKSLRSAVEGLLRAHELPDNVLDQPAATLLREGGPSLNHPLFHQNEVTETPGTTIGPYRLMEQIGEGGFGLVFVAEQLQPVCRKVALKVIKPGMDTREVIARFEAERQALAMMDHPNIARVLDAGTTSSGRPYFVMELVRGVPITTFCEQKQLSLRARLELFIAVCNAVQHAHQKGVIHRDIKPSNVLVTLHDETAVPKVIDFGVAKALGHALTDKTIYTRYSAMIGTPLYMSPEQAEMSGLDVDTRSDIYALGVLLFELLTGSTPFERARFDSAGIDEIRRIIREEDPPRPSTRLTTAETALRTVSNPPSHRPVHLSAAVRGDLDWIVMKTLEKDRNRRYESASELADDVRRFLAEQPIQARPPSQFYQLQKFARRNRVSLITLSLILTTMILATVVSLWQASVAVTERNQKDAALKKAVRLQQEANTAREEIAQFAARMKEANVLVTSGRAHADGQHWGPAYADFTQAVNRQPNYYNAWSERASLLVKLGLWKRAARDYSKAIELGVPADNPANWGIPQLFLLNGDNSSYRDYCLSMLAQYDPDTERPSLSLIRSCVVARNPVTDSEILAEQAVQLLDLAETSRHDMPRLDRGPPRGRPDKFSTQDQIGRRPPPPQRGAPRVYPRGVRFYVAGLALYRAERYEEAVSNLEAALLDQRWRAQSIVYPVLAMAYHRIGNADLAREAFAKSEREIDNWTIAMEKGPIGSLPIPWFDWVECRLLHREASILLTGLAPADDPRLRNIQQRAEQLLEITDL